MNFPLGIQRSADYVAVPPTANRRPEVTAVAFYLPQFYPIPENDAAWGEGFTEWRNVARGQPEFTDHHQPRAPANYGYYDLRLPQIQVRQAADARAAGIGAFCYYYYWFDGRKPLELPLINHRDNPDIDLPFCLCFANENWTKRWDGLDDEVIFKQVYGKNFADRFWDDLTPYLNSDKYLRDAAGRPVLLIYRPSIIPSFARIASGWRKRANQEKFPGLHLVGGAGFEDLNYPTKGLDSYYEFPPLNSFARTSFGSIPPKAVVYGKNVHSRTYVQDYRQFVMTERLLQHTPENVHPAVMPGWDNVGRRPFAGNAFTGATPKLFEQWTQLASARAERTSNKLLFINAWNEWAEGAYLEPDQRHGWAFLSAFSRGICHPSVLENVEEDLPVAIFAHVHYADVWDEMCALIQQRVRTPFNLILTTSLEDELSIPKSELLRGFEVHRLENRGRDIFPFLIAIDRTKFNFDVALKLHTKRSPHRIDGDEWRRMLVDDLLPPGGCDEIVSLLRQDANIGFVGPQDHWVRIDEHIGSNQSAIEHVMNGLQLDFTNLDLCTGRFIAGSMFWFRKAALRPLDSVKLHESFAEELGQVDGTSAHALERLFSLIGERNGYVTASTERVEALLDRLKGGYPLLDRMAMYSDQMVSFVSGNRIALSLIDVPVSPAPLDHAIVSQASLPHAGAIRIREMVRRNKVLSMIYRRLPERIRRKVIKVFGFS